MGREHSQHFCIAVVAQGKWRPKDIDRVKEHALSEFYGHADQGKCETCCSCPVCRALWDLFDPDRPSRYDRVCEICGALVPILKKASGPGDTLTLFSHSIFPAETLNALSKGLLGNKAVKKVLLLQLDSVKIGPKAAQLDKSIRNLRLKTSEFLKLVAADKFECGILYEVVKDSYY